MRISMGLLLLGAALAQPASAQNSPAFDTCVGRTTPPDQRVAACTDVIDGKAEAGKKLTAAYCNRGHGYTEKRDLDRALADLDEALRLDPVYPCALSNRGRVYAFKHDLDRAIADYDEAIRIDPGFALAYNNRGDACFSKGDPERALADFNAAITHNPSLAIAYANRGFVYYRKRDFAPAIADYTTEIRLQPDVLAYINRGNAYRDSEQLDRAAADYAEVIKLAPSDARGWRNRGLIRLFQGDNKAGIADYDKALQYDPADVFLEQSGSSQIAARRQARRHRGSQEGAGAEARPALRTRKPAATRRHAIGQAAACRMHLLGDRQARSTVLIHMPSEECHEARSDLARRRVADRRCRLFPGAGRSTAGLLSRT